MFGNNKPIQNEGVKYSKLLEEFILPFKEDFVDVEFIDDIFDFAMNAWNFGNIKTIVPRRDFEKIISAGQSQDIDFILLKKMIDFKAKNYKEYTNFIVSCELKGTDKNAILSVVTQEEDAYLETMLNEHDDFDSEDNQLTEEDFEENYINRSAIVLKPLQPFFDWINALYPEDKMTEVEESNTYLVNNEIEDVNTWLKKKYDKLFKMELDEWHSNKKEWPRNRNYKMFKQWFHVDISTMIYDLEKEPVSKSE